MAFLCMRFHSPNLVRICHFAYTTTRTTHLILEVIILIIFDEDHYNLLRLFLTSSRLAPNSLLSALFSDILRQCETEFRILTNQVELRLQFCVF